MMIRLACVVLGILGLAGCSGTEGTASVTGTDPASLKIAPAGVATLVFMDLETVRPDLLVGAGSLPGCVTANTAGAVRTYTFTACTAANGGTLTGTVAVTPLPAPGNPGPYTETYDLTVQGPAGAQPPTQTWRYTGTQTFTVTYTGATPAGVALAVAPDGITAAYTDSANPANNRTYTFQGNLAADLSIANRVAVSGSYLFKRWVNQAVVETLTATLAAGDPLVWSQACSGYPASGTITLDLVSAAYGTSSLQVAFDAAGLGCGVARIGGATLNLGNH
jgi:hypothetical protein